MQPLLGPELQQFRRAWCLFWAFRRDASLRTGSTEEGQSKQYVLSKGGLSDSGLDTSQRGSGLKGAVSIRVAAVRRRSGAAVDALTR